MNAPGYQTHLGQVFQNQAIPFVTGDLDGTVISACPGVHASRSRHGRPSPIVLHAAATALLTRPSSRRSTTRSCVAGSRSSGTRGPAPRKEIGNPVRIDSLRM